MASASVTWRMWDTTKQYKQRKRTVRLTKKLHGRTESATTDDADSIRTAQLVSARPALCVGAVRRRSPAGARATLQCIAEEIVDVSLPQSLELIWEVVKS